jgi:hypothetical protein
MGEYTKEETALIKYIFQLSTHIVSKGTGIFVSNSVQSERIPMICSS